MTRRTIVTIFGGSAPRPGAPAYQEAELLGQLLAQAGFTIATGGYIGTMEALSKGAADCGGHVIGVTCDQIETWRAVRPNRWVTQEIRLATLRERVYRLIEIGDALVALPGGLGTLSEIALAWSLLQTNEITSKLLIMIGEFWKNIFRPFLADAEDYLSPDDRALLTFASDNQDAMDQIERQLTGNHRTM